MSKEKKLATFRKDYSIMERYRERIDYSDLKDEELKLLVNDLKKEASFKIPVYHIDELTSEYLQFVAKAIALINEVIYRKLDISLFPTQVKAALAMHKGIVVNMDTGEGKTLAGLVSAFLNVLFEKKVFIVTANDYLSKRDCEQARPIIEFLGFKVSSTFEEINKKEIYNSDIIYTTSSSLISDFLKSLTAEKKEDVFMVYPTQTNLKDNKFVFKNCVAIIDEIDYVLLDEGNSIQSISNPVNTDKVFLKEIMDFAKKLDDSCLECDNSNQYYLSEIGLKKVCNYLEVNSLNYFTNEFREWRVGLIAAINALKKYHINDDYIVKNSSVLLIDKVSGRVKENARLPKGIHQMLELKEGVEVKDDLKGSGSIVSSLFYKTFEMMTGMSGTIKSDEDEMFETFGKYVVEVRSPRLRQRYDHSDVICQNQADKMCKIISRIKSCHEKGQPILCVVANIKQGEELFNILKKKNIKASLLSAKNHEQEAEIIANSGVKGNVTIATIMAGRGVDIITNKEVQELGGLFVLGCSKFHSLRIDNQFRGRTGRQGAPGETEFYVSLDDEIAKGLANKMSALAFAQEKFARARKTNDDVYESDFGMNKILDVYENAQREKERENRRVRKFIYDTLYNTSYEFLTLHAQRCQMLFFEGTHKDILLNRLHVSKWNEEKELKFAEIIKENWLSFYESDREIQRQIFNKHGYTTKGLLEYRISNAQRWHEMLDKLRNKAISL